MISQTTSSTEIGSRSASRWRMAFLVSAAIVLSYLDRQTLPWTLSHIHPHYPFSDQIKVTFDSALLVAYGLMYLSGGHILTVGMTHLGAAVALGFGLASDGANHL